MRALDLAAPHEALLKAIWIKGAAELVVKTSRVWGGRQWLVWRPWVGEAGAPVPQPMHACAKHVPVAASAAGASHIVLQWAGGLEGPACTRAEAARRAATATATAQSCSTNTVLLPQLTGVRHWCVQPARTDRLIPVDTTPSGRGSDFASWWRQCVTAPAWPGKPA